MSTTALESEVFRYVPEYFASIGRDEPDVVAFKALVEQRDLRGLRQQWCRLTDSFTRLEAARDSQGRPRFMDVYYLHFESLLELCKRCGV